MRDLMAELTASVERSKQQRDQKAHHCTCEPGNGCDGEGFDPDDPRTCVLCRDMDGEWPCPADFGTYDATIEGLMDDLRVLGWEAVVVCTDGSEPFASLAVGHGLVLDLTCKLSRTDG